jgi:hypothetical protein
MKIEGPRATAPASSQRAGARTDATGFALPAGEARAASATGVVAPLASLDAVLALQMDPAGRRRRQARRGAEALDALDRLAAAMLAGEGGAAADLARVSATLADREPTGDAGLDSVLQEIDVRSAVELAKREKGRPPA